MSSFATHGGSVPADTNATDLESQLNSHTLPASTGEVPNDELATPSTAIELRMRMAQLIADNIIDADSRNAIEKARTVGIGGRTFSDGEISAVLDTVTALAVRDSRFKVTAENMLALCTRFSVTVPLAAQAMELASKFGTPPALTMGRLGEILAIERNIDGENAPDILDQFPTDIKIEAMNTLTELQSAVDDIYEERNVDDKDRLTFKKVLEIHQITGSVAETLTIVSAIYETPLHHMPEGELPISEPRRFVHYGRANALMEEVLKHGGLNFDPVDFLLSLEQRVTRYSADDTMHDDA